MVTENDVKHLVNNIETERNNNKHNKYEFVMGLRETLDPKLFPMDFDTWDIEKKEYWIYNNLAILYPNVPKSLLEFIPASYCEDSNNSLTQLPEWFDLDKYRRGQKFAKNYFISVGMLTISATFCSYSFQNILKTFILGNNIHTPYLGLKRYMSTITRITSWYKDDPWVPGTSAHKDMQITRAMHLFMRKKLSSLSNEELEDAFKLANPWCPSRELLLKDFATNSPPEKSGQRPYLTLSKCNHRLKILNNADLAIFQCTLLNFILTRPECFGVHNIIDEDVEAFCHMWRLYGYLLGIEEKHNFCRGTLEEIKERTRDINQYWIITNFKDIPPEWEHLTRCVIESMNYYPLFYMPYKSMLLLITDALDLNMPHLYASLGYLEWMAYKTWKFIFRHAAKLIFVESLLSKILFWSLNKVQNYSPAKQAELEEKSKKRLEDISRYNMNNNIS